MLIDLVFVATLIQAGDRLLKQMSVPGLAEFTVFFALLWWAWSSLTIHFARRESDDITARLIVFVFVFAIGCIGVLAGRGHAGPYRRLRPVLRFGAAGSGGALCGSGVARRDGTTPCTDLRGRLRLRRGALAASALVPEPWRFGVWALAIAAEMATGLLHDRRDLRNHLSLDASRLSSATGS